MSDICVLTEMLQYQLARKNNLMNFPESKGHHHVNAPKDTVSVLLASKQQNSNIMIKCNAKVITNAIQGLEDN